MESIGIQYLLEEKGGPVWAMAVHEGHELSAPLVPLSNLSSSQRLREEDPYTGTLTDLGINRLVIHTSRFQLDLNRPIADAVYTKPGQAWGLQVWNKPLPESILDALHQTYYYMQKLIALFLEETIRRHGFFLILDIHSYNARRNGPMDPIDTEQNPQLNIGTIHNGPQWRPLIEGLLTLLQDKTIDGQPIDVRENVKFSGGYLSEWVNGQYGHSGCVLSLEFRKDFMDEWTGVQDTARTEELRALLRDLVPEIEEKMRSLRWTG